MPGALSLDASTTSRLAALDPALLPLARAEPPSSWLLHDVRWMPGEGCRLAYRVPVAGSVGTFAAVDVTAAGWSTRDYREDVDVPGLRAAADPVQVADLLDPLVGAGVRTVRVEPVRYRPGSRCVLRYDVESGGGAAITLYAKAFRAGPFDRIAGLATALGAFGQGHPLVPEVTAVWPQLQVVVGRGATGRTASGMLGDPAVPTAERAHLAHRVGDLLARFHAQADVDAPLWTAADQVASLADSMVAVRRAEPRLAGRLQAAVDLLDRSLPPSGGEVLGHGAFRAGQVLVTASGRLVVLDTDGVSRSHPGRDIGSVLAHLQWQGIRQPAQRDTLRVAEQALLAGYGGRAGQVDSQALLWWRAAGLLQVAARRYRRLEVSCWPLVAALADATETLLATRRTHAPSHGSADLLDPVRMSAVFRVALASIAVAPPAVRVDSADELAAASGRRCVVRYTVRGLDGPEPVPVIGKRFAESRRARLLHEHLCLLSAGPFGGELRVPQPLALVPEQRLVLFRPGDGVPLDRLLGRAQALDGVVKAARWLARLHTSGIRLPRRLLLAQEEKSARQWATRIACVHPSMAGPAHELADQWAPAVRSAAVDTDAVLHKDFHAGHVLLGDGVCVIDLDEARHGDPAFDVAHFCTYLELDGDADGRLRDAFRAEYGAATGWTDDGTYRPFCAYTWLKIAKQCAVGSGPFRDTDPKHRLAPLEQALAKGTACLIG